jgi:carbon-monoxide dehydrogenase medium subunit
MMKVEELIAPGTIDEVLQVLDDRGATSQVLAGGTDVMVRAHRGEIATAVRCLVSLHQVAELRGVRREGKELVIGATTTATELISDPLVKEHVPILAAVADRVASAQIRNVATIGGNLVNASPAGDLINPLLLLDAEVVLASVAGRRTVPVFELFVAPGRTVLDSNELLVEVRCRIPPPERVFHFEKAGTRPAMECSVVTVGLAYTPRDGALTDVRITIGSCGPTPLRGRHTEAILEGKALTPALIEQARQAIGTDISPISDIRGTETYRRALVAEYLKRMLESEQQR